jgi:2-dehydro-3-deoxygluconokinase
MGTGLVTVGETMALLTAAEAGPLRHVNSMSLGIAGAESNVAVGAARLGLPAAWIGRVGRDELGALILARLRAEGVDVGGAIEDPSVPTSLMLKERRAADIVRVTYYRRDGPGARLHPDDLDHERIAGAAVLHVTGITPALSSSARATVEAAIDVARAAGVLVSFDLNYRAALWPPDEAGAVMRELARRSDVVFAGDDEAALIVEEGPPEALAAGLAALSAGGRGVVKLGPHGAVAAVDGGTHQRAALTVESLDPVGAGDAFVAGYLVELAAGEPPERCLETATACGAFAVTVRGDWEGAPTRAELALLQGRRGSVHR